MTLPLQTSASMWSGCTLAWM